MPLGMGVSECTKVIIPQLERILKSERVKIERNYKNVVDEDFLNEFEEVINDFKFVKESIENSEDPSEYSFDNWCEAFNEYMEQLYDISDAVTNENGGFYDREKFLWID